MWLHDAVLSLPRRPRLRAPDRLFWLLTRVVRRDWRRHLVLVRPDTVVRWHRAGFRAYWRQRISVSIVRDTAEVKRSRARVLGGPGHLTTRAAWAIGRNRGPYYPHRDRM